MARQPQPARARARQRGDGPLGHRRDPSCPLRRVRSSVGRDRRNGSLVRLMRRTLLIPSLLLAACATAPADAPKRVPSGPAPAAGPTAPRAASTAPAIVQPKVTSAADLVDHLGDSVETALSVPKDAPNDGP